MKTKIFTATNSATVYDLLINELKKNNANGSKHVFVVPDRFTLSYESEILEKLDLVGSFNIDVLSFRRVAYKFLPKSCTNILSPEAGVMLLRRAIDSVSRELKSLRSVVSRPEFASDMYAVITNLRNSDVSWEQFADIAKNAGGSASNKACDMALIYKRYLDELADCSGDSTTLMRAFVKAIPSIPEVAQTNFYFADFYSFTAVQEGIVKGIAERGLSVNFAVPVKKVGKNSRLYPNALVGKIEAIARSVGVGVEIVHGDANISSQKLPIHDELFGYSASQVATLNNFLSAYVAKNPREEAFFIASKISEKVFKEDYRYRDFAVVSALLDESLPYFEEAFSEFNIPYFADVKRPLSFTPAARFLLAVLNAARKNLRRVEISNLLGQVFSGIEPIEASIFLEYSTKYNIEYGRLLRPFNIDDERYPKEVIERVRTRIIGILTPFLEKGITIKKRTLLLKELLDKYYLSPDKDLNLSPEVEDASRQAVDRIGAVFEGMVELLGDTVCDLDAYYGIFSSAIASIQLSFVPQRIDNVFLGDAGESRYSGVKVMFVSGAIPREGGVVGGIISLADETRWSKFGLKLTPNLRGRNVEELFTIKEILEKPSDELIITRVACGMDAKPRIAGQVYSSLCKLYGVHEKIVDGMALGLLPKRVFRNVKRSPKIQLSGLKDAALPLMDAKRYVSPSRLEKYLKCPFSHYAYYGLRLKEKESSESSAADIGELIHAMLEMFFSKKYYLQEEDYKKVADDIVLLVLNREKYKRLKESAEWASLVNMLKREAAFMFFELAKHVSRSSFKPAFTEAKFDGDTLDFATFDVCGEVVFMRGIVDRIDVCDGYAVIVDYKTASEVDFKLRDVLYGSRLQLFLYAGVLLRSHGLIPAGLFYLPLPSGYSKNNEKSYYRYSGFITNDSNIALKLDNIIDTSPNKSVYPAKIVGNILKATAGGTALSDDDFTAITDYVKLVAEKALSEIFDGRADISPLNGACEFCSYHDICRVDTFEDVVRKTDGVVDIESFKRCKNGME